tara:strand:- start:3269 stop:3793 length:525 start_codon:yes stop_codon:yes gene_type:complete
MRDCNANIGLITYVFDYAGESVLDMMDSNNIKNNSNSKKIIQKIFAIIKRAQDAKIFFDPHPKNFVLKNEVLTYVDFTPPWTSPYFELRKNLASAMDKEVLENFFYCMHWEQLGFHIAGDLLKIDPNNEDNLFFFYEELIDKGMVNGDFELFCTCAKKIIERENMREKNKIFLL